MKRPAGWANARAVRLAMDGHECADCHAPCPHPRHHDVDHVIPLRYERNPQRSLDPANLRTRCKRCHLKLGAGRG